MSKTHFKYLQIPTVLPYIKTNPLDRYLRLCGSPHWRTIKPHHYKAPSSFQTMGQVARTHCLCSTEQCLTSYWRSSPSQEIQGWEQLDLVLCKLNRLAQWWTTEQNLSVHSLLKFNTVAVTPPPLICSTQGRRSLGKQFLKLFFSPDAFINCLRHNHLGEPGCCAALWRDIWPGPDKRFHPEEGFWTQRASLWPVHWGVPASGR